MFVTTIFYCIYYYIFIIILEVHIRQAVVNYVFPAVIAFACIMVYIGPKADYLILNRKTTGRNYLEVFYFFPIAAFIISAVHLVIALGSDFKTIHNVPEINKYPDARYYYIENFEIDTIHTGFSSDITKSRKHGTTSLELFVAAPLKTTQAKKNLHSHKYWVMQKYYLKVSSGKNTDSIFKQFTSHAIAHFKREIAYSDIDHFERLLHSHEREQSIFAISNVTSTESAEKCIILIRDFEPVAFKGFRALFWMFVSLVGGSLIICILLLFVRVSTSSVPGPEDSFWFKIKKHFKTFIDSFKDNNNNVKGS